MGISPTELLKSEAKILGRRWLVKWEYVLVWMKAREIYALCDLIIFDNDWHIAQGKALNDFWEFST